MRIERISPDEFAARDEAGVEIGRARVVSRSLPRVFADEPLRLYIDVNCEPEALYVLYGAAVTRAGLLASLSDIPCGVYADVAPNDVQALEVLDAMGFEQVDGLIRMYAAVTDSDNLCPMPRDCAVVRDYLGRETEREMCLKRYNDCFGTDYDMDWLIDLSEKPDFARLMLVSKTDMCGEVMVWREGDIGVIGTVQTAMRWRGCGVATYLLEDARVYFSSLGLKRSRFDVWLASPGCRELAQSLGYSGKTMLRLYQRLVL